MNKAKLILLEKMSDHLKKSNIHLTIENMEGWLSLRGILPSKFDKTISPSQQRIPLGLAATPQGINQAKDKALEIRGLLNQGRFDWAFYLKVEKILVK